MTKRDVSAAAWREYKESRAAQGAAGEEMLAMLRPPGGFVAVELGFGFGEGPSILATLQDQVRAEQHHRVLLGDRRMVRRDDVVHADEEYPVLAAPRSAVRESTSARAKNLDVMMRRRQRRVATSQPSALERAIEKANAA